MRLLRLALLALPFSAAIAQRPAAKVYTHADSVRGSNGRARAWWDATFYDLHVTVNPADSSVRGWNTIHYKVLKQSPGIMQIDLQQPLDADSIKQGKDYMTMRRDGNALMVILESPQKAGENHEISVYYHGKPRVARRAPWDGGFVWTQVNLVRPWIATANEIIGANGWGRSERRR